MLKRWAHSGAKETCSKRAKAGNADVLEGKKKKRLKAVRKRDWECWVR